MGTPRFEIALIALLLLCGCEHKTTAPDLSTQPQVAPDEASPAEEPGPVQVAGTSVRTSVQVAGTWIVMLGAGTPIADPSRSGPSLAVVVDGVPYIVDFGPGVVRRAASAHEAGIEALAVENLSRAFCTHLHSDHTAGYPDLILTPWVLGRKVPLEVYGPPGMQKMTDHVLAAWAEDIAVRAHGNQPSEEHGWQVVVHEIEPGEIYRDDRVVVTAFDVQHGAWEHAYGFRFETADRTVVISGDTVPVEEVARQCDGCDVLVHEVYAKAGFDMRTADWQAYHAGSHTSGVELGKLAQQARPKLLVLTHQLLWGATEEQLLEEIRAGFDGEVVYANDLDVF